MSAIDDRMREELRTEPRPATQDELVQAISYALRFRSNGKAASWLAKRIDADTVAREIIAALDRSGLYVMKKVMPDNQYRLGGMPEEFKRQWLESD